MPAKKHLKLAECLRKRTSHSAEVQSSVCNWIYCMTDGLTNFLHMFDMRCDINTVRSVD